MPSSGGCARGWTVTTPTGSTTRSRARSVRTTRSPSSTWMRRPVYSDLPEHLRRYRADIFDDKYKRLNENGLSRTITAHIAKDGYWYIHPRDNRTLTVREAARLQTFPDRYRFAGPPSAAFRQIGNAVPPFLGEQLGLAIRDSLDEPRPAGPSSLDTGNALAAWFRAQPDLAVPWLRASTRWQVISARFSWNVSAASNFSGSGRWSSAGRSRATPWRLPASWQEIARWVDRGSRAERLLQLAGRLADTPEDLDSDRTIRAVLEVHEAIADLAVLAVPSGTDDDDSEEPVLAGRGVLRVASRFTGEETLERKNRMSDGRLAVARMIGYGDNARDAHLGLIELAAAVCRPEVRACDVCPLAADMRQFPDPTPAPIFVLRALTGSNHLSRPRALAIPGACLRQHSDDATEGLVLASLHRGRPQRQAASLRAGVGGFLRGPASCGWLQGSTCCSLSACRDALRYRSSA